MKQFFIEKVTDPIAALLKQGLTPNQLALSFSMGAMIGVVPIIGTSSILCVVLASIFRLNQVAIQIANYLVYPLQFLLLIPFVRMGEWVLGKPNVSFDPAILIESLSSDFFKGLQTYGESLIIASLAWLLCSLPALPLIWGIIYGILKRTKLNKATQD